MRKCISFLLIICLFIGCNKHRDDKQSSDATFNKTYTSKSNAYAKALVPSSDGGYFVAGYTGEFTDEDAWVVKLDKEGNKLWERVFSWQAKDEFHSVSATQDGGCILAGTTFTTNNGTSGTNGINDAWALKLDSDGNTQWDKIYGGQAYEDVNSIIVTLDGGYIMAGKTRSTTGDVSGNHGVYDAWVVKLSQSGTIQWQRALGGSAFEEIYSAVEAPDGGYVMAGYTNSNDGDVSGYHGASSDDEREQFTIEQGDAWVVKLDKTGNKLWQRTLGGSLDDEAYSIAVAPEGGLIVAGGTSSNDGDVAETNHRPGLPDAWVVKLDGNGNTVWQKTLGGSLEDVAKAIVVKSDGSCTLSGWTFSNDGDVSGLHGSFADLWCVKLDKTGTLLWQKPLGGSGYDQGYAIAETKKGNYVLSGMSTSKDGDLSGVHLTHQEDAWVFTLNDE